MSPLTEPPPKAVPGRQAAERPTGDNLGGNDSVFAAANPFLARWLHSIASDGSLPFEALEVAIVMARSVGVGRVAFTDWQRINAALGRIRKDRAVFETMSELELEGYLDRDVDDHFVYGWSLLIPEGEL